MLYLRALGGYAMYGIGIAVMTHEVTVLGMPVPYMGSIMLGIGAAVLTFTDSKKQE